jgi:ABC-2 type transport system permease protein
MFNGDSLNDQISSAEDIFEHASHIITGIVMASPIILMIAVGFCIIFTALSVLYDERKNKSILFWKSMPVSDTQEVLVKLATVIFVTPIIAIAFALIIQAFTALMLGILVMIKSDYSAWDIVFSNIDYLTVITSDIIPTFVVILWALPIFTWFMLVSSFSKRSPFLLAFIIPALVSVAEGLFFNSSILVQAIVSRFSYLEEYGNRFDIEDCELMKDIISLLGSFSQPSFWVGLVFAAAMIGGCIQLRKRNSIT